MDSINSINFGKDNYKNAYNLNFGTDKSNLEAPTKAKCGNWTYDPQAILTNIIIEDQDLMDSINQAKKEMQKGANTYSHDEIFK